MLGIPSSIVVCFVEDNTIMPCAIIDITEAETSSEMFALRIYA